jgi:hypothetical protein
MFALLIILLAVCVLVASVVYYIVISGKPQFTVDGRSRILKSIPSQAYIFGMAIKKSFFAKRLKSVLLPDLQFVQNNFEIKAEHVTQYRDICGFALRGSDVPVTYPYLLIFPLQGLLLIDQLFPFQAMGLVHLANRIQQFGAIMTNTKVTASVKFDEKVVAHPKGYCFTVISEIYSTDGALLWRCESTYLSRSKNSSLVSSESASYASKIKDSDMMDMKTGKDWSLSSDFGRKYASVSGDFNPIHLYAFTAKLFGFPHGCIMHGMWSVAACAAALIPDVQLSIPAPKSKDDPSPIVEVYAEMKLPMYLPNKPVLQHKEYFGMGQPTGTQHFKNSCMFELDMKMKREKELVPHLKGWCSWN